MAKTKDKADRSPLVTAAAALEEELRAFADLATDARRESLNSERSMSRAAKSLTDSVQFHTRIEERLRALVSEIDSVRKAQQESVEALVEFAHEVERRSKSRDAMLGRFAELGAKAGQVNSLAIEMTTRQKDGAAESELLERLGAIEQHIDVVVAEARSIAGEASTEDWPEIGRQAEGLAQQMQAAKNKLALAHQNIARRAPS
jgi:chromosome segregation ATPase